MAHDLAENLTTGRKAVFSVKETPWHGEGFVIDTPPTWDEAMRLSGADYDVVTEPVYVTGEARTVIGGANDGERVPSFVQSAKGRAVVRTDTRDVLGIVTEQYRPIQNREAFEVLKPLIDGGVATIETGGVLGTGEDAWLMVKFIVDDPTVREAFGDEIVPFGLITNNHNAKRRAVVKPSAERVVCRNTLDASLSDRFRDVSVAIVHRGMARQRLVEAAETMFSGLVERYVIIAEQFTALKGRILTAAEFERAVLDVLAPMPKAKEDRSMKREAGLVERVEAKRDVLKGLWSGGRGHVGDSSAWEAYNAAAEALDHDLDLFKVGGSRVRSLMQGRLYGLKHQVADNLMEMAMVPAKRM